MSKLMSKKIGFQTLGCRLNQFETESLATQFMNNGYSIVDFNDPADAYIINTCTVTSKSDRKSRNIINRVRKRKSLVVVTGCFAESAKKELEESGITFVISNDQKQNIFHTVDAYFNGEIESAGHLSPGVFNFPTASSIYHTRGTVKIQDGCNNFCTFCIIPFVRGRAVSRLPRQVLDSVKQTIDAGYKEIVLTGINISRYEHEKTGFTDLLEQILNLPLDFRLRISSIEPDSLTDHFISLFDHPKMCHHLHLCLQSASEEILLKMRRQYSYKQYAQFVEKVKKPYPLFNFTTDLMLGFPGESESDFKDSFNSISENNFGHVHTFPYSIRKGTRAERMPGQIPHKVKKERAELIRIESEKEQLKYRNKLIGKEDSLLVEKTGKISSGYGNYYVPIELQKCDIEVNTFRKVMITDIDKKTQNLIAGDC